MPARLLTLLHRVRHEERGQSLVEFALVLPLLLLILFGTIDFARAYNYWNDTNQLAAAAARYAAVNYNPGAESSQSFNQWVLAQAETSELSAGSGDVNSGVQGPLQIIVCTSGVVGDPVKVRVKSAFKWLPVVGMPSSLSTVTLRGQATMRLEQTLDPAKIPFSPFSACDTP